jgi:hypothetical protein
MADGMGARESAASAVTFIPDLLALTTTKASTEAGEGADIQGKPMESEDATN